MLTITVLVIDDDDIDFISIKRTLLKFENVIGKKIENVIHCKDSLNAIDTINNLLPDLILCDYNMPGLSGIEILKAVKKTDSISSIPFIVLTGMSDSKTLLECLEEGAIDFVEKGSDRVSIVARIKSALRYSDAKKETDMLLQNILPIEAIKELKSTNKVVPKKNQDCSVLFTDFVGFTEVSSTMEPELLVTLLNFYFSAFDRICEKWHVDKIKTIGDAYMCVSGLRNKEENCASNIVNAAIEMMQFTQSNNAPGTTGVDNWSCRIGISSGDIVTGIIGEKKFAFDVWGPTVNVASRMETASRPNKIKICDSTYNMILNDFSFERIEKRHYKGLGDMETWYVNYETGDTLEA